MHISAPFELHRANRLCRASVVAAAVVLVAAGCGSDETTSTGGAASQPATEESSSTQDSTGQETRVNVSETEFTIKLSDTTLDPGDYVFEIKNAGSAPHNLAIEGPGVSQKVSDTFQGGQSGELDVMLKPGTYTLWCAVGAHRAQGMETKIKVNG